MSSSSSSGGGGEQARRPRPRRRPVQILEFLLRDEHRMSRPKRYREQMDPFNQKFYSWKKKTKQDFCSRCNWLLRSLQHKERLELYSFYGNWKFRIVKVRVQEEQENNAAASSSLEEDQQLGEPENNASFEGEFEYEDEHSEEGGGGDEHNPEIVVSEREVREQRSGEPQNNAEEEQQLGEQENNASFEGDNRWFEGGYDENFEEEECEDEHDTTNSEEEDGGDEHNPEVRHQVRHGRGSQRDDEYLRLRRKRTIAMTRKKSFADIGDFAALAKFSALFRLLLLELPIQRYPLVLPQFEERINREMRESLGKNVLKHNVPTSVVSALLGSHFEDMVEGFKLKIEAGI